MRIHKGLLFLAALLESACCLAGNDIAAAARQQVGVTLRYDPSYQAMAFPNGDIPRDRGVCTDVVVRALRDARAIDLQQNIHADMTTHWAEYPHRGAWRHSKPDANIDHRRVPNLMTYFERQGYSQPVSTRPADYATGDIVAWDLGGNVLHIGVLSELHSVDGRPLVIHNIGSGTQEEDVLFRFRIIGHYRLPAGHERVVTHL